jgi:hypothetical protein
MLGEIWKTLSEDEKAPYYEQDERDKVGCGIAYLTQRRASKAGALV